MYSVVVWCISTLSYSMQSEQSLHYTDLICVNYYKLHTLCTVHTAAVQNISDSKEDSSKSVHIIKGIIQ